MENETLRLNMLKKALIICGSIISLFLIWFAISDYRAAAPIAEETLRGFALTLTAAIEHAAQQDPSFKSLAGLHPSSVAFFAIIDRNGIIRFHSNQDLIGTEADDNDALDVIRSGITRESRVVLGTAEKAYVFYAPLDVQNEVFALKLTLHTYRANAVIRRARIRLALLVSLLVAGWILAAVIYRFAVREEMHQQKMAQRENLARLGEMGALLAHEIRNPLAGIKGFAQVIEKKPADDRNRQFAESIVTEVRRLESLVSDLLSYARRESYEMVPVDLNEIIDNSVHFIREEAGQFGVSIEIVCHQGLRVIGNRDRLGQVLLNLAKNAIQAMPGGGVLRISAEIEAVSAITRIADTGQGIKGENMERIFEPFFTTNARGTGLGLSLCRKIITEHKGTIKMESTEGEGTTVTILLPLAEKGLTAGSLT
jgi:two-component system, NtrC family, sensor histidine kinase HydH